MKTSGTMTEGIKDTGQQHLATASDGALSVTAPRAHPLNGNGSPRTALSRGGDGMRDTNLFVCDLCLVSPTLLHEHTRHLGKTEGMLHKQN